MAGSILVVDGLAANRITVKVRLAAACHAVLTAGTEHQMLAQLRSEAPALLVLGGGVDGLDAVALCTDLRRRPEGERVPILMLVPPARQIAALRAGATAVLDPRADETLLRARVRALLRDAEAGLTPVFGFAEAPAAGLAPPARIVLVAGTAARALCWKHLLGARLRRHALTVADPDQALAGAAAGEGADLYLIGADLAAPGDGLRLLSELRARPGARDAAFLVATADLGAQAAMALDLGAAEVLGPDLGGTASTDAAALLLAAQLDRKQRADRRRAETARQVRWALTDPLTGLWNRRHALPALARAVAAAAGTGPGCAVLALDIDRFKAINDRHGHAAGDAVLAEVAARIEAEGRGAGGLCARIGGEEFMLLLPGADEPAAFAMAESVRHAVMARPVPVPAGAGGGALTVTLSIGVAMAEGDATAAGTAPEVLAARMLDRADRAMLAAKARGRNRVMMAPAVIAA